MAYFFDINGKSRDFSTGHDKHRNSLQELANYAVRSFSNASCILNETFSTAVFNGGGRRRRGGYLSTRRETLNKIRTELRC